MKNPRYVVFSVIRQILTCQLITIQMKQALRTEKQCVRNFMMYADIWHTVQRSWQNELKKSPGVR